MMMRSLAIAVVLAFTATLATIQAVGTFNTASQRATVTESVSTASGATPDGSVCLACVWTG
jgi:hypothetical protein